MRFRKKPVVIEAMQWTGMNEKQIIDFCTREGARESCARMRRVSDDMEVMFITTLEGEHCAKDGDWIIKGVHEEFYPCKPDIFQKTYERVD